MTEVQKILRDAQKKFERMPVPTPEDDPEFVDNLNVFADVVELVGEFPHFIKESGLKRLPAEELSLAANDAESAGLDMAGSLLREASTVAAKYPELFQDDDETGVEESPVIQIPECLVDALQTIADGVANGGSVLVQTASETDTSILREVLRDIHQMFWEQGMPQAADMVRDRYLVTDPVREINKTDEGLTADALEERRAASTWLRRLRHDSLADGIDRGTHRLLPKVKP